MEVHRSNRTEKLVEILCGVVRKPLASPFAKECIVVQGRGMERWLSMQLAQRLGVWANPEFPFPRSLIERAFAAVSGDAEDVGAKYQPETLLWAIADLLPGFLADEAFRSIRSYLGEGAAAASGVRLLQLSERIATTFDQYVVYRPEMVRGWKDADDGRDWQPILWRALVDRLGDGHLAAREQRFLAGIATRDALDGFPARISLFGLSTLPPLYVRVLFALSKVSKVHLFLLSPSSEYWAEIRSKREQLRAVARATRPGREPTEDDLHLEEGNPLLASLGRLGRDFQFVLEEGGDYETSDDGLFAEPATGPMLGTLQSDILHLRERRHDTAGRPERVAALPLAADDRSIAVHSCHAPMREVEVLHDQLSRLFEELPGLEPRDVVVMTPAIDTYAPLVEAVFGETESRPKLPYRVADRGVRSTDEIVDALSCLLDVVDGRMTATDVLDLLRIEAVRRRFAIEATDVELVRHWVDQAGIRWGIDERHRAELGQPELREYTWRFGLDRVLLGYAMPAEGCELFRGTSPYDDVEGSSADLLGRLAELCATLFRFHDELRSPRSLAHWRDAFGDLLDDMIASDDATADQHNDVKKALTRIVDRAAAAGFDEELALDAVRPLVLEELTRAPTARGFLSGGITFCEMVPMRAIPFRVVCLLGMNGDAFPRVRRPLGFDKVAQQPRRGDRSSREDDRYLFLEALLSARDRLLITYVGQSIRDNTEQPPSVAVSELLDALGESFVVPEDGPGAAPREGELGSEHAQRRIRERIVVRHPLQPFSTRYFTGDATLFSYATSYYQGAESLVGSRGPAPAFAPAVLAEPENDALAVDLSELTQFLQNPAKYFLQQRLRVSLGNEAEPVENREPLQLDQLASWAVGDKILKHRSAGRDAREVFEALRAAGKLPLGSPGMLAYDDLLPEVRAILARAGRLRAGRPLPPLEIEQQLNGVRLTGLLEDLFEEQGQVRVQFSRLRRPKEITSWVNHLALQCFAPPGHPRSALLVGRQPKDGREIEVSFKPVADPAARLGDLIALLQLGATRPVPFFPGTSRVYVERLNETGSRENALEDARAAHTPERAWGEGLDEYNALAFSGRDPFEGDPAAPGSFHDVALRVYGPMLDHREAKP
jgi:exodeoxyribonuclease V gamma subunit